MNSFVEDNVYRLVHDQRFFNWVLRSSEKEDEYWKNYILQHPSESADIEEARIFIKGLAVKNSVLTEKDITQLKKRIDETINSKKGKSIFFPRWRAAASIFIILGISGWMAYQFLGPKQVTIDYSSIVSIKPSNNNVTLILADSTKETFTSDKVELAYDKSGSLISGSGQVKVNSTEGAKDIEQLNQLVVPFGKRSNILLSDGTKLWLNSGSRAIYPVVFNKKYREIYVEGEAYLEVAHSANQPFYVKTDKIKVKVLGTKFNISAYADDQSATVVLVEGSVEASIKSEKVIMKPNQVFSFEKHSGETSLKRVNVLEYVSWKDGWLLCNKENLKSITSKISRYYNIQIEIADEKINSMTLSGKLDLKTDLTDVLNNISTTAPVKYEMIDSTYRFSLKN